MKSVKLATLTNCSEAAIAEMEAVYGAPSPAPAEPVALRLVPDANGSTVRPAGDLDAAEARKTMTVAIIDRRLEGVVTPERRAVLEHLRRLTTSGGTVPRSGQKYHLRLVLQHAGVRFSAWVEQAGLREDVERIAPLLPLDEIQASAHVRNGPKIDSIMAMGRRTIDEMEAAGEPVPRESQNSRRPSGKGFAERMGVPHSVVYGATMLKQELSQRVAAGRLVLGDPYQDPLQPSRAERRTARKMLTDVLLRYEAAGTPIPASSERSNKIDIGWLLDEAGITEPRIRECMKCDPTFRRDLAGAIRKVRMQPVHLSRVDPSIVTYERLREQGRPLLEELYRADTPRSVAGSDAEARWVDNQLSFLSRAMRTSGRGPADDAAPDFGDGDSFASLVAKGLTDSLKGNAAYERSLENWRRITDGLRRATSLPASFAGALDAAMVASGRTAKDVAAAVGCRLGLIHSWRRGGAMPTYQNQEFVTKITEELGLPKGTLSERLPQIRSSRTMRGGRREIAMEDGSVMKLSGLWRYMHPDAPIWSEDRLRDHVRETHARVYGVETAHRVRQRAAMSNAYDLPEPDPASPIWRELDDLIVFKTGVVDDGRLRDVKAEWRSDATVDLHRKQIAIFARWLTMPVARGGAGVPPRLVSFSLVMNRRVVLKYVTWRALRAADLEVNGVAIGPRITSTEKSLLFFFAALTDPTYGWLTQSRHVVLPPEEIAHTYRMPFIRAGKAGMEVVDDETCPEVAVMPADVVEACATDAGWKDAAATASAHIRSTGFRFAEAFKLMRDPQELVMPILRHQQPIAVGFRMAADALRHARPLATSPRLHAKDVQQVLAFMLLLMVAFRSDTLRNLTWRADGTGNLRRVDGEYEIVVGADHFKNGYSTALFGPSWNRRDYERTLGAWGCFNEAIGHYLEHCRPILLAGRESDLLFPPPRGRTDWSDGCFNTLVTGFTRKWCVYNPRFGTGMRGVAAFGPHPARNIVATHIIRNHPTEDRWRLASLVLGTGIDKVKLRYGWISNREELAKTDYLLDAASALAASDAPLY